MRADHSTRIVTWNGGEEYLHAIAAQTYPFENTQSHLLDRSPSDSGPSRSTSQSMHFAAPCAKDACEYLKKHVPKFVGEDKADETQFNEILSVAYSAFSSSRYSISLRLIGLSSLLQ